MRAVIMAGGAGSRLRPLTCNLPKPLARLCGKPVLEYIFDLLIRHGMFEATLTLGYLGQMVEEQYPKQSYRQLEISFVTENTPLGTAGGVALAARGWDEPFLVISGDAMCDLDLTSARQAHLDGGAAVTIVGVRVEDPREYGLMEVDGGGYVRGFVEKPAWGQATGNLANTGIYIIRPDCMDLVPEDRSFDFAKDLFPMLMERGESIYCCELDGYWCDIGDLDAYRQCQNDMLERKVQCAIPASARQPGVFTRGGLPQGSYQIITPVYIGDEVEIANGAVIGPHAVLDDGVSVGERAKVRESILLQNAGVSPQASLTGAIVCAGAAIRRGASLFEGSAVGAGAIIGANAAVRPSVSIWPEKQVQSNAVVRDHLKYGGAPMPLFEDDGVGGADGLLLTAETCAALGAAIGSIKSCKKAGIACDGTGNGKALMYALLGGLMTAGSHVWSFGECFEAELFFFTAFCGLGIGIFVQGGAQPCVRVCGEGGLSAPRYLEREIESKLRRGDLHRCGESVCKDIADMSSIRMMYTREMMKLAPNELHGCYATVRSESPNLQAVLENTLERLGCVIDGDPVFTVDETGAQLQAHENGTTYHDEQLLAICCQYVLEQGSDLALPYDAPEMLDALAAHARQSVHRYLNNPADQSDGAARKLAVKQLWVRDALFRTVQLLAIMKEKEKNLAELFAALPPFYVEKKSFSLPCSPAMLGSLFDDVSLESAKEGIVLRKDNGRILITPSKSGRRVRVFVEAANHEIARELCADVEKALDARR
ncbi:MAG: NTP transferase domain-containing protein [Oscillospiraceae bacterium]|nr:NTP transferase domain-containing protein [Oscillospiraceae bacterium]